VSTSLQAHLRRHFGYETFRAGQEDIIRGVLAGANVLGVLATGGGKSVTYQLPALMLPGITVVVSPLISLMMDQVQQMRAQRRIAATYLNSLLDPADMREVMREIESGMYKLVYISPEKLQQSYVQALLKKVGVSLIAIDEAHCISQWGHDFRTDYLRLPEVVRALGNPPVLAVTATATTAVREEICSLLKIKPEHVVLQSLNRKNIAIDIIPAADESERRSQVLRQMDEWKGQGIVYCSTRQAVEVLATSYQLEGKRRVHAYHGGMNSMERMLIQQQFLSGDLDMIVATNAFGMGIDKPDIRFVIHYQLPASMEAYVQEIGRVGRDGEAGYAALYYTREDVQIHQYMIEREYPTRRQIDLLAELLRQQQPLTPEVLASIELTQEMADLLLFYAQRVSTASREEVAASLEPGMELRDHADQVYGELERRKLLKQRKLAEMIRFAEERENCLRKRINGYFGEMGHEYTLQCCSVCGLERSLYKESRQTENVGRIETSWDLRQALSVLLPK